MVGENPLGWGRLNIPYITITPIYTPYIVGTIPKGTTIFPIDRKEPEVDGLLL